MTVCFRSPPNGAPTTAAPPQAAEKAGVCDAGKTQISERLTHHRRASLPPTRSDRRRLPSGVPFARHRRQWPAQQCSHFFLDINDDFRFAKLFLQPLILPAQLLVFHRKWIVLRLGSALPGKRLVNGGVAFAASWKALRSTTPLSEAKTRSHLSPRQRPPPPESFSCTRP